MLESSKYNIIWKNTSAPNITTNDDCEYASFLKDLERVCCKAGYLDSKFYTKHLNAKSSSNENKSDSSRRSIHAYDVANKHEKFLNNYEKEMKRINKALLQEKRDERVLKRHEGDIIKRQHNVSQSLRDFESDVNNKKFQQDLKLNSTAENLDKIRKRHYYEKSLTTKERMRMAVNSHTENMGKSRRVNLNVSRLMREFNSKKNELESNSSCISRLMEDFENHLSREENKHKKLQKELESITDSLKLEINKSKTQESEIVRESIKQGELKDAEDNRKEISLTQFLSQSDGGIKDAEMERKALDVKLGKKNEEHSVKRKENLGALNTIRNKLAGSESTQRKLIGDAEYINLMMKRVDNQNKIESATLRRSNQQDASTNEMIKIREVNDSHYEDRMFKRQIIMELGNESDNMTHLKSVIRNEKESEQKIFKKMNDASKEIKQASLAANLLSKKLHDLQESNASRINEDMREANKHEREMDEELIRQRTKLIELQSRRNNYFNELLSCRKNLHENNYRLEKSEVKTARLSTIKDKSDEKQFILPHII